MTFLSAFLEDFLIYAIMIAATTFSVLAGIGLRKRKNRREQQE